MSESFSTGLFGCCSGSRRCCANFCGCACTSCVYGDNVQQLDGRGWAGPCCTYCWANWVPCCFQVLVAASTRTRIREMYGLKEEPCSDTCVHCWCSPCAVCQEARELKARGTPLTGYGQGIAINCNPHPAMAAPAAQTMEAPPTAAKAASAPKAQVLAPPPGRAVQLEALSTIDSAEGAGGRSVRFGGAEVSPAAAADSN